MVAARRPRYEVVEPTKDGIGRFVVAVVNSWDAKGVTEKMELAVGSDLQYVRISGTLVAAVVGSLLFLISELAG